MANKKYHRKQANAHQAVHFAKRFRLLKKPSKCSDCGLKTVEVVFHHTHGYAMSNWLKGSWVCPKCHSRTHHGGFCKERPQTHHIRDSHIRMPESLLQKLIKIAKTENRSVNAQIMYFLRTELEKVTQEELKEDV